MLTEYLALDIETTGLSPEKDRIIEIGAVKFRDGKPGEEFSCLVRTCQLLPPRITQLTGITVQMLEGGCTEREAVLGFLDFAEDMPVLLGHNIKFDYSFIKVAALRYGRDFERRGADTLSYARELHPELESRSLGALCARYNIEQEHAHRAVEDALCAHRLYQALRGSFPDYDFRAAPLCYKPKKQEPMTPKQKKYLKDLLRFHSMEFTGDMELLTKSDASRMIDRLILAKGRLPWSV